MTERVNGDMGSSSHCQNRQPPFEHLTNLLPGFLFVKLTHSRAFLPHLQRIEDSVGAIFVWIGKLEVRVGDFEFGAGLYSF